MQTLSWKIALRWLLVAVLIAVSLGHSATSLAGDTASDSQSLADARKIGRERSTLSAHRVPHLAKSPEPDLQTFASTIQPILHKTCVQCHGEDVQEGNVRIDTLDPNLATGNDIDWWLEVQAVLSNGEMPPPEDVELPDKERAAVIDWLANEIQVASLIRRSAGEHSSFRRMTRYEFNYALQDLLGLPYDFAKDLPPEANSEDGFQNSSELLHMSVSQLETYRRLARRALRRATVQGERPPVLYWGVTMENVGKIDWAKQQEQIDKATANAAKNPETEAQKLEELEVKFRQEHSAPYFRNQSTGRTVRASWSYGGARYANAPSETRREIPATLDHVAILPRGNHERFTVELGNRVPDEGIMRVRVRASRAHANDAEPPTLQLLFGWQASNEGRAVLPVPGGQRTITAGPDQPEFYQWDVPLGEIYPRNSVRKTSPMGAMPNPSEYIRLANRSVSQGAIQIDYVEIAAPVYDEWPPSSHTRIFMESEHEGVESAYAREVIGTFMKRAWRRPLEESEIDGKLQLFATLRPECDTFQEAVLEVLATVLASPQFLYVSGELSEAQELPAHDMATRLSMFLWCSIPDAELRGLADSGKLLQPEILQDQIRRMTADARTSRMARHFVNQWLDMQLLEFRNVPRHQELLKEAMQREPVAVFEEMVRMDASVLDFLHADYTLVNERLAAHYGLTNVKGNHFRRVALAEQTQRGGLLTQAGLLAMNSAGDDSHPLKRGVWLLESLLNDPPPPPPPAVPEIDLADPEIAKLTLKEQIEDHRNHAACMSCHAKIDPWGIAFENYDAMGRWRDDIQGTPVDATSTLFNNQKLAGMTGLKRYLLEHRQDQFVRAMVHKLATFALGRPLAFSDRSELEAISSEVRRRGDGLTTMIQLIASSELFRNP